MEYLAGRRTRYFAPLRVYLVCSFLLFFFYSVAPEKPSARSIARKARADSISAAAHSPAVIARADSIRRTILARVHLPTPPIGPLDRSTRIGADSVAIERGIPKKRRLPAWIAPRAAALAARTTNHGDREVNFKEVTPRLMFVLMPVFALFLSRAYRRRRKGYPTHLIVALQLHAFAFVVFIVDHVRSLVTPASMGAWMDAPALIWLLAYLVLALRRVYGGRMRFAVLRAAVVMSAYAVAGTFAVVLVIAYQKIFS